MSSTETDSSCDSEGSEALNYLYEIEEEHEVSHAVDALYSSRDEETAAFADDPLADDPLADAEWTANYEKETEACEEQELTLRQRFEGSVEVSEWCKCGNCNVALLQNISECYCCYDLEGCHESMESDLVVQDLDPNVTLKCITEHPGFNPVCLQKWSLRLAATKHKTKGKHRYRQKGSEESFLRSVSYREFSRLVYGFLGNKRIPLPACAYTAIRKEFPVSTSETYTGFELDDED